MAHVDDSGGPNKRFDRVTVDAETHADMIRSVDVRPPVIEDPVVSVGSGYWTEIPGNDVEGVGLRKSHLSHETLAPYALWQVFRHKGAEINYFIWLG